MASWSTMLLVIASALHITGCGSTHPNAIHSNPHFDGQADDPSPYAGRAVPTPDSLAGLWEAPDGQKGTIGIHLRLVTTVPATATSLARSVQSWSRFELGVYERKGPSIGLNDEKGFTDWKLSVDLRFDHGRLRLHSPAPPSVDLDLAQSGDRWIGRFHLGAFDHRVVLRRPGIGKNASLLVGTWQTSPPVPFYTCAHIVQTGPNTFTGWFDSLGVLGLLHHSPNVKRSTTSIELYGDLMEVRVLNDRVFLQLPAFADAGICCSHAFVGSLTEDGSAIQGIWPSGPNQERRNGKWTRIRGNSCGGR